MFTAFSNSYYSNRTHTPPLIWFKILDKDWAKFVYIYVTVLVIVAYQFFMLVSSHLRYVAFYIQISILSNNSQEIHPCSYFNIWTIFIKTPHEPSLVTYPSKKNLHVYYSKDYWTFADRLLFTFSCQTFVLM